MRKSIVAPSILNSDFGKLRSELNSLESAGADYLHLDVMDGNFVPPITFGDNIVKLAKETCDLRRDVHVMIAEPEKHFTTFLQAGAEIYTFHLEATSRPTELLKKIKESNIDAGLAIKPETDFSNTLNYLELCDLILIMTVNPGYGGQKFMPEMLEKIKAIRQQIDKYGLKTKIQVDGGIDEKTGKLCFDAGADILVAGTFILNSPDYKTSIAKLRF